MIHRVFSDLPAFKEVKFDSGFNVVLADRTRESTKKDTRNGLGKSTLISIVHFVLGGKLAKGMALSHPELDNVNFGLELTVFGSRFTAIRNTHMPKYVLLEGDITALPLGSDRTPPRKISIAEWTSLLGLGWFGIPAVSDRKYRPTFRSAVSYVARQSKDAYSEPFRTHRVQATWDIQVHNAFLLGLAWEDASDWQVLRDRKKLLDNLKTAAQTGIIEDVFGSRGQLEAERVRLKEIVARTSADLKSFKVHSTYDKIRHEADALTAQIRELSNQNTVDERLLQLYKSNVKQESKASAADIRAIYDEAKLHFPEAVKRHLQDVETFHSDVIEHRRQFLLQEVDRLTSELAARGHRVSEISEQHALCLETLNTHGALEQYTRLQEAYANDLAKLRDVESRLKNIRDFEEGRNSLKIEMAMLEKRARDNYDERSKQRETAVGVFNENSEALYNAPGRLMIEISDTGFSFDVEIERKGSTGISNMEIFCYDLMLAQCWSERQIKPGFLLHDSNIFADVDDRQIALAIELAELKSREFGFQYICTFNSDKLPIREFSPGFNIIQFTRLRLTDQDETGGILGKRLAPFVAKSKRKAKLKQASASL